MIKEINGIMVVLLAGEKGKQLLFVALTNDNGVSRMGIGNYSNDPLDNEMFIGKSKDNLFQQARPLISNELLDKMGHAYSLPNPKGEICKLRILLQFSTGESTGIEFIYGAESMGPPPEIGHIATTIVQLTNQWYSQQKDMVRKSRNIQ
jgi:hypothetical protein